jgi:hypothetical protein
MEEIPGTSFEKSVIAQLDDIRKLLRQCSNLLMVMAVLIGTSIFAPPGWEMPVALGTLLLLWFLHKTPAV